MFAEKWYSWALVILMFSLFITFTLVSKLSKRISSQESTRRRLETEVDDLRRTHSNLLRQHEVIVSEQEYKISVQEHLKIMDDCRR